MFVLSVMSLKDILDATHSRRGEGNGIWILLLLILVSIIRAKFICAGRRYTDQRAQTVDYLISKTGITISLADCLIDEIKDYIRQIRTFAAWFVGIAGTFIVLLITIGFNWFVKNIDILMSISEANEIKEIVERTVLFEEFGLTFIIDLATVLLPLICVFILLLYSLFSLCTFAKKQVLFILYDVKYQLMIAEQKRDESAEEAV